MEIQSNSLSIPTAGYKEALARTQQGEGKIREIRENIQTQADRIRQVQREVSEKIYQGRVGILGSEQLQSALAQAKQNIQSNPTEAKAAQSLGVTSIGTFGVSFA